MATHIIITLNMFNQCPRSFYCQDCDLQLETVDDFINHINKKYDHPPKQSPNHGIVMLAEEDTSE